MQKTSLQGLKEKTMLNNISIMGRIVKDPEVRKTTSGKSVCTCTIANDRPKSSNAEKETDFLEVTTWHGMADFIGKYFTKGKPIVVTGRLQTRSWQDKEGKNRKDYTIVATSVDFVPSDNSSSQEEPIDIDSLPF